MNLLNSRLVRSRGFTGQAVPGAKVLGGGGYHFFAARYESWTPNRTPGLPQGTPTGNPISHLNVPGA